MNNQFSENLKRIRKEHNLSQEQLADELGVSRQSISKWESGAAYPEMDKIIALCNKFNVNIDDLLYKDIKEVKGEEESKKKLNNFIDDFLKFITDSINLFTRMNFKSKMKCLFEQAIIAFLLFIASAIVYAILDNLFSTLLLFLPGNIYSFNIGILDAVMITALVIVSLIIISHIFKTRYLDYYDDYKEKEEKVEKEEEKEKAIEKTIEEEKISLKKEDKIVIRDPKHSEYRFINGLFRVFVALFKFFILCFAVFVACGLIALLVAFVSSFLLYNTGLFFIGLLIAIVSTSIGAIDVLLIMLNFVFDRKGDKKKIIWTLIASIVGFGIGLGLLFVGALSFNIVDSDEELLKVITKEYEMNDNFVLYDSNYYDIEYIESDNNNVKIEYSISKYCDLKEDYDFENGNGLYLWTNCENPMKVARDFIKGLNDRKIIELHSNLDKITVYTTKANIEKIRDNWEKSSTNRINSRYREYEIKINELENENDRLRNEIDVLKYSYDD